MTRDEVQALSGNELRIVVATKIMGWRWWAFSKDERDTPNGDRAERVVRALRPPDFDTKPWEEWATELGKVFRPADGTEPVERIQGTVDAMRASVAPDYLNDANASLAVLCQARGEPPQHFVIEPTGRFYRCHIAVRKQTTGTVITTRAIGIGDTIGEAICRAALLTKLENPT